MRLNGRDTWRRIQCDTTVETLGGKVIQSDTTVETPGGKVIQCDTTVETPGGKVIQCDLMVEIPGGEVIQCNTEAKTPGGEVKMRHNGRDTWRQSNILCDTETHLAAVWGRLRRRTGPDLHRFAKITPRKDISLGACLSPG
jgi:hypothetical protein